MADLFKEIIPSITTTKQRPNDIDGYNPFLVNISLANYVDCILYVNEMNMVAHLSPEMQYDYYFNAIRKTKRRFSYEKKVIDENLTFIKEYYDCSTQKAKEILQILTKEQINTIITTLDKGGNTK